QRVLALSRTTAQQLRAWLAPIDRRAGFQRVRALQGEACLAHHLYAIAGDLALHRSPASAQLLRAQRSPTQSPGPIRCECAVYRAGRRILSDADGWGKKSGYVIHVGFAARGHNRTADPGVELGESGG